MLRRTRSRVAPTRKTTSSRSNSYDRSDSRPRYGHASQNYEKFCNQAKEALSSGDRVTAERLFQHADHYLRLMNEAREKQESYNHQNSQPAQSDQPTTPPLDLITTELTPAAQAPTETLDVAFMQTDLPYVDEEKQSIA